MYYLSNSGINDACEEAKKFLTDCKIERRETVRLSMMLEEALLDYQARFGEAVGFTLKTRKLMGRIQVAAQVPGESYDPFSSNEDEDNLLLRRLQVDSSSASNWSFRNGVNTVSFVPEKKQKLSSSTKTILAMLLAVPLGMLCGALPEGVRAGLLDGFVSPTLGTIMGVISAVAGPMIFFSLLWGVCTIGDVETLSKIGKRMIGRFLLALILLTVLASAICYVFCRNDLGGSTSFQLTEFYKLLLGIVPKNMVEPFISGNTQQIIFLAMLGGVVLLLLGDRVTSVTTFASQFNIAVQYIMTLANTLVPFMVFLSIFNIVLSGQLSLVAKAYKLAPLYLGLSLLVLVIYTIVITVKEKIAFPVLIQKTLPVFVLGLSTASSAAALSLNMSTCEEKLGIDQRIVSFGVPLGQTLFKPGGMIRFVTIGFCFAELYDLPITINLAAVICLTCFLLSVSAPPVAGGSAVCFAILFEQLGIPGDAIGFALAMNVLMDFVLTAVNLYCLEVELTGISRALDMLDMDVLRAK